MILLLCTATPLCQLTIVSGAKVAHHEWQADRQLAKGLLGYVQDTLAAQGATFNDITAIGVFKGPGSFTGLRIGLTVANTLADALAVPIVGGMGDDWQEQVQAQLKTGSNEKIILPYYGAEARITAPRK